jgi:hypothetical protein
MDVNKSRGEEPKEMSDIAWLFISFPYPGTIS